MSGCFQSQLVPLPGPNPNPSPTERDCTFRVLDFFHFFSIIPPASITALREE